MALHEGTQGVVGESYPGTGKRMVGPLKLRRHSVAEVLDELVAKQGNSAWVVQVPPQAADQLAPEGLWMIIDYDDPAFDQAIEALKKNILRYKGTNSPGPHLLEDVQISSVSVNPNTINASSSPTSAIVTVQVYHTASQGSARVRVNIATFNPSPPGNSVSFAPATRVVPIIGFPGYVTTQFTVNTIPGTTVQGNIRIKAWLTDATPANNVIILDPNPVANAQVTLSTSLH